MRTFVTLKDLTLKDIQFATGEEIRHLMDLLHKRGVDLKIHLVLDKEGKPLEAFAFEQHAGEFVNSTLQTGLDVKEMQVWWSGFHRVHEEHDADRPSMP